VVCDPAPVRAIGEARDGQGIAHRASRGALPVERIYDLLCDLTLLLEVTGRTKKRLYDFLFAMIGATCISE
jgi:hypothetical protein